MEVWYVSDMPKLQDTLAYPPRAFDADRAAAYVCLSKSKFLDLVDTREAPQPVDVGGCPRWDRRQLDDWFDGLSAYAKKTSHRKILDDLLRGDDGGLKAQVRQHLP